MQGNTFERFEEKYLLTAVQYQAVMAGLRGRMQPDLFGRSLVSSIYYDTPDYRLIRSSLEKYDIYSVSSCSCRAARRTVGEGCGHLEQDMCIQMGKGAEYYIRTGRARQVSRAEVEEILRKAEENGLMHNIPNIEEAGETAAICNCCACACFGLRVGLRFGARDAVRSNFVAQVDAEKCVACGQCVENCPGNALMLGQKLCTKTPVAAMPEVKKITEHAWSKADWNVDYRENRKDVVDSGTAPCKTACPAHIAIQGYIKLAAQGKYLDALELIKKENPFPAICGRICNRRCESECTRGEVDEPIAIDEVKKFIADAGLKKAIEQVLKIKVIGLPVDPQLMGALGAAEFARKKGLAKA